MTLDAVHDAARTLLAPEPATIVVARPRYSHREAGRVTTAVCFDVDFTLIYPGPTFRGRSYRRFGVRHGLDLDESGFDRGRGGSAAPILDAAQGDIYDAAIFHRYTASIIRARWAATGPAWSRAPSRNLRRVGDEP